MKDMEGVNPMRNKELIIAFVINIASGIVSFWILKNPVFVALFVLATVLSTIILLLFLRIKRICKAVVALEHAGSQSLQCCGLHLAGFSQVYIDAKNTRRLTFDLASRSYNFLGVSGEFVAGSEAKELREMMKQKARQEGCCFQLVLLDPDADDIVERHARQEGSSKEAVSLEIRQTIAHLKAIAEECSGKLEVWLHHELPIFRLVLVDNERAFVSFYGARGALGIDTPQLVFHKTDCSFFVPFSNAYEETLRRSKRLI